MKCEFCGRSIAHVTRKERSKTKDGRPRAVRKDARYCSARCRFQAWHRDHPRVGIHGQR